VDKEEYLKLCANTYLEILNIPYEKALEYAETCFFEADKEEPLDPIQDAQDDLMYWFD
jgi:hypothetical protein